MPRMTPEQFERLPAKMRAGNKSAVVPLDLRLKSALVGSGEDRLAGTLAPPEEVDPYAVGAGKELELHAEIMKECRRRGWPFVYHDPSRRTGATLGCPDFIIYASGGRVLNVECKTATGTLSDDQEKFRDGIVAVGHEFWVVRSLPGFLKRLKF